MQKALACMKRPCRICSRWFMPNPRLKDRQKTCGDAQCKREWHRRKCAEWNKENSNYFKANYLQKKLDAALQSEKVSITPQPKSGPLAPTKIRLRSGLPFEYVQEVIGTQHLIIIEYLAQLLFRRFQEVLKGQVTVMANKIARLPP